MNNIRDVSDNILVNKAKFMSDISNLKEILEAANDIKKRYRDIFVQISDRQELVNEILKSFDKYQNFDIYRLKTIKIFGKKPIKIYSLNFKKF